MMRVHLRGVVIGVSSVLAIAVVVSIFNALETPDNRPGRMVSRHALSADDTDSEEYPRSAPRQRAGARAGGPGGARAGAAGAAGARGAGGPGARAGGAAGGARAAGARAGGGPRARGRFAAAQPGDETAPPVGTLRDPGTRGAAARNRPALADLEEPSAAPGGAGARRRGAAALEESEESPAPGSEELAPPRPRGRAGGMTPGGRAPGRVAAGAASSPRALARTRSAPVEASEEEDEETETPKPRRSRRKDKTSTEKKENDEEKREEEKAEKEAPKKKEPPYPEWWKVSYPRSSVSSLQGQFVGDQPLFGPCPSFAEGSGITRYGHVEPPNYMRNSKNPCWFEWNGKKDTIKCLPYFYLVGTAKSAVADVFRRVAGHPSVLPGGSNAYRWWNRLRYGASKKLKYTREAKRSDDPVPLKVYAKAVVGKNGKNLTKELLYKGKSESIFGDASPTYLTDNTQWDVFEGNQGCSEPRVIPATFIRHTFPDARVIVILRDPVERLYSQFLANVPYVQEFENATASLFHTFTVQAVQTYRDCFAKASVRHCAYNASLYSNAVIRLSEGMYPVFLEDWFRVFPKEQVLVLKFEEYVEDVKGHLLRIFDHLGLEHLDDYNLLKLTDLPVTRKGRTREEEGPMMPETAALLAEFYSPFLLRLADTLGDDKWLFPRPQMLPQAPRTLEAHEEGVNQDAMPNMGTKEEEQEEEEEEEKEEEKEEEEEEAEGGGGGGEAGSVAGGREEGEEVEQDV